MANSGSLIVALDATITNELRGEGIARELVNRIQNLRKDSKFEVTDKINIILQKHPDLEKAVLANIDYIKAETLTANLTFEENIAGELIEFDNITTKISINKH